VLAQIYFAGEAAGKGHNQKLVQMEKLPKWLRYLLIGVAILYLFWLLFLKSPIPRTDFPFYKP
jgi:hypothetical protein